MNAENKQPELTLKDFLMGEKAMTDLRTYLGKDENEIKKFTTSVLMQVMVNKKLQECSHESILTSCIDAVNLGLTVDNRNHAYIVPYWNGDLKKYEAKLQIGYKGYIYKIKQAKPDADFKVELVFEGDEFTDIESVNGIDSYKYIKRDPFKNDPTKVIGAFCYISYMANGERKGRLTIMGKEEIDKIKALAKSDTFWGKWYNEKAKVAVIRRASKIEFASIVEALDSYDNENYIDDSAEMTAPPKSEGLLKLSDKMKEQAEIKITPKSEEILDDNIPDFVEQKVEVKKETPKPVAKSADLF